jgi:predicted SnoaL-like aldol condensation-catalyzing enzyme
MSTVEARNKALVLEAMTSLFQRKDPLAVERLYSPDYIQHNSSIAQGREALSKLVAQLPAALYYEPGMIIAEGAYVAIHGRIRGWAPNPQIVVDIFRIEDGKLAEHWDVLQDEESAKGSKSGMAMFSPSEAEDQARFQASKSKSDQVTDYDVLMQANLKDVFGEPDAKKRMLAIQKLYAEDAILNEPEASVRGHVAICDAVSALLSHLPPSFVFTALGPATGHHGIGRLRWSAGPPAGPVAVTGMDIAHVQEGRIHSLSVFLDPPAA